MDKCHGDILICVQCTSGKFRYLVAFFPCKTVSSTGRKRTRCGNSAVTDNRREPLRESRLPRLENLIFRIFRLLGNNRATGRNQVALEAPERLYTVDM